MYRQRQKTEGAVWLRGHLCSSLVTSKEMLTDSRSCNFKGHSTKAAVGARVVFTERKWKSKTERRCDSIAFLRI